MKFRKKPVIVDAFQWNPLPGLGLLCRPPYEFDDMECVTIGNQLKITTLEGVMTANPGDWIIRGVKGEFYPCKPDIFEQTYELV